MTTTIQNTNDLLGFLNAQAGFKKDWFGFSEQKLTAITLAHKIAEHHADKMTPAEIVKFSMDLNEEIYHKIIRNGK